MKYFLLCSLLIIGSQSMGSEPLSYEILHTKTQYYSVTPFSSEPKYPDISQVINNPVKVEGYKKEAGGIVPAPVTILSPDQMESKKKEIGALVETFGTGEIKFKGEGTPPYWHTSKRFLFTGGIGDCVGLIFHDGSKSVLFHASKMEIRHKDDRKPLIEQCQLPAILKYFDGKVPAVLMVSTFYTRDFLELKNILEKNGIVIGGINVPDMVFESSITKDEHGDTTASGDTRFVSQDTISSDLLSILKAGGVVKADVLLDTETGEIFITRG